MRSNALVNTQLTSTKGRGEMPRLAYKIKEAAEICGLSQITIRRAIERGQLKPSRAFRHVLIPADQLHRLVSGEVNP